MWDQRTETKIFSGADEVQGVSANKKRPEAGNTPHARKTSARSGQEACCRTRKMMAMPICGQLASAKLCENTEAAASESRATATQKAILDRVSTGVLAALADQPSSTRFI
jgi:hypothetical protein